jgi:SAM-dependent MidA family methyltransferase
MTPHLLQQLIIERIERAGPITFADYMRMALYEPGFGYYVTGPTRMGWEGSDYYTNIDVSTLFASCMGRQLLQMWQKLGHPVRFIVLEQGAGRDDLAQGVRSWAAQEAPAFNAALDYRIEDMRTGQDAIVGSPEGCERNKQPARSSMETQSTPSVILSNELVDAFPVHIVEAHGGRLYELFVDVQQGRLREVLAEPSTEAVASYLDRYRIPWPRFGDGWRAEINLDALCWIERVAHLIRRGFILTIDYGDRARNLYTRNRRCGTLACYSHHHLNDRPLARPGEQDITAHVNFSALINAGRQYGLRLNTFATQRLWLENLGIYDELEGRRRDEFSEADTARSTDRGQVALLGWYNLRQRVVALTDPAGMGNFKVLILSR